VSGEIGIRICLQTSAKVVILLATVAVIEQEQDIRALLDTILKKRGFTTVLLPGMKNSELRKQKVDLVVADLYTVWTTKPEFPVPFMMIASYLSEKSEEQLVECGARSVLRKPFRVQDLVDTVTKCL
jgi:DNA-binding response OmpR family regulator